MSAADPVMDQKWARRHCFLYVLDRKEREVYTEKVKTGELVNRLRGSCELRPGNLIWIMPT